MTKRITFEINFHQQDELSIYQESTLSGDEEELSGIFLFINYGLRQMSNLGICETTDVLARTLIAAPPAIQTIAAGFPIGDLKLISYPGTPGRKKFLAGLEERGGRSKFDLKMIGFGFLARGFGYYAPMSTLGLMSHLARRRHNFPGYLHALAQSAALCGQAQLSRSIGLANQPIIAERILATICGLAIR